MKKVCSSLLFLCLLLAFSAIAIAAEAPSEDEDITIVGVVIYMDDGIFIDDGAQIHLMVGMDDPQYAGLTVEVIGESLAVDGSPAIKVKVISIIDELPQEGESGNSTNSINING
ncbi:hypothetical protein [Maridesulfovibrio ferrireducens]|uniref:hypothetical protein n=1 Tax=Maridesulfovibrio ferrireducens TaxID=246191 RepID=UPI001A30112D|nr:hypothetical protein [Maridesulfovibrio ferrireducens]MBI9112173.1 hypothetical protein [Maridesulfovibrio ferrireducens]